MIARHSDVCAWQAAATFPIVAIGGVGGPISSIHVGSLVRHRSTVFWRLASDENFQHSTHLRVRVGSNNSFRRWPSANADN